MGVAGNKSSLAILLLIAVVIANCGTATSYTVQPGDSLSGIAERHNTTFEALVEANAGRYPSLKENPRLIYVGWELVIPGPGVGLPVVEAAGVTIQGAPTAIPVNTEAIRQVIIRATNEERVNHGLPALRVDPTLMDVAQQRAREVSANFDHYGAEGEVRAAAIAQQLRYSGQVGENCALRQIILTSSGPTTPELAQLVMQGWMSSSGHRTNILLVRYSAIGVGVHETEYKLYAVQVFGTQ